MLDNLIGFHIELTNMCTLKCPRCARTNFIERFPNHWTNKNLDLDNLKKFLDIDLSNKIFSLCGSYGDAIYYDRLFDAIDFFKQHNAIVNLATNGSYQKIEWWETLASKLTDKDSVTFAIDGLPDNFTKYRINADWQSMSQGIDILARSDTKLIWQYIVFSFNENDIAKAEKLSVDLGFDKFNVLRSDRFENKTDWLRPTDKHIGDRDTPITLWKQEDEKEIEVVPICKKLNNQHYISADGYYMPCCYVSDHRFYYKSEFYKNRDFYDISKTTITKLLQSTQSIEFYNTLEDAKLSYCTFNCPKI
jgi:MoaA/NifB/PqqE/SkfB family radical SAM enzyme